MLRHKARQIEKKILYVPKVGSYFAGSNIGKMAGESESSGVVRLVLSSVYTFHRLWIGAQIIPFNLIL